MGKTYRSNDENKDSKRREQQKRIEKSNSKKKFIYEKPQREDKDKRNDR